MTKQSVYLFYKLIKIILMVQFLVGCSRYPTEYPTLAVEELTLPVQKYRVAQELKPEELLLEDFGTDIEHQFIVWNTAKNEWQYLPLPNDSSCKNTFYHHEQVLSPFKLAVQKYCLLKDIDIVDTDKESTLVVYDLTTKQITPLSQEILWGYTNISSFDWNTKLNKGVVNIGALTETMYLVTPDKKEPLDFLIESQGDTWSPAKTLEIILGRERGLYRDDNSTGNTSHAAWSPNGEKIVFWVTPGAVGRDGMSRATQPKYLFEIDPNNPVAQNILEIEVYDGHTIKWHPQNEWILFVGEIEGETGLWMFNVQNKRLRLVSVIIGKYTQSYLWADGGDAVIFTQCDTSTCESFKTFKYEVKDVLASGTD